MSAEHEHQVEETRPHSDERFRSFGAGQSLVEEPAGANEEFPEPETAPTPLWLVGVAGGAPQLPPDPKMGGKALFSANCITCHQANGEGVPGQYPPLAGSEVELGDATNHLIAIVLKGLQGPVVVEGKPFNNAMQAWEGHG